MSGLRNQDLLELADELAKARQHFLDVFHEPVARAKAKQALLQLMWDDKSTIIFALREAAGDHSQTMQTPA